MKITLREETKFNQFLKQFRTAPSLPSLKSQVNIDLVSTSSTNYFFDLSIISRQTKNTQKACWWYLSFSNKKKGKKQDAHTQVQLILQLSSVKSKSRISQPKRECMFKNTSQYIWH